MQLLENHIEVQLKGLILEKSFLERFARFQLYLSIISEFSSDFMIRVASRINQNEGGLLIVTFPSCAIAINIVTKGFFTVDQKCAQSSEIRTTAVLRSRNPGIVRVIWMKFG